jgi:beta-hydroxylase
MFLDPHLFEFVEVLESGWTEVRQECLSLPQDCFEPWVQRDMYGEGWSVYGLIAFGERIEAALRSCPRTASLLGRVPGLTTAGFSRMAPQTQSTKPGIGPENPARSSCSISCGPERATRVAISRRPRCRP